MHEAKMLRAVAVVDIPYSAEKWERFKEEVLALKLVEPVKQDVPGFVFRQEVGAPLYPPALYISDAAQNALTRKV